VLSSGVQRLACGAIKVSFRGLGSAFTARPQKSARFLLVKNENPFVKISFNEDPL